MLVIPIGYTLADYFLKQFEELLNKYDNSTNYREYVVAQALVVWNEHRLFGAGVSRMFEEIETNNTMNTYVYILGGQGIFGMILFLMYIYFILKQDIFIWIKNKELCSDTVFKLSAGITILIISYSLDVFGMAMIWILPVIFQIVETNKKSVRREL